MASEHGDLQVPNPQMRKPSMTYVTLGLKFIHLQNKICWTTQALAIKFGNSLIPFLSVLLSLSLLTPQHPICQKPRTAYEGKTKQTKVLGLNIFLCLQAFGFYINFQI